MDKAIEMSKEKIAEELKRFAKKEVLTPEEVKCYGEFIDMRSGHSIKDRMIASLEQMYANALTDHERQVIDKWIAKMRSDNT